MYTPPRAHPPAPCMSVRGPHREATRPPGRVWSCKEPGVLPTIQRKIPERHFHLMTFTRVLASLELQFHRNTSDCVQKCLKTIIFQQTPRVLRKGAYVRRENPTFSVTPTPASDTTPPTSKTLSLQTPRKVTITRPRPERPLFPQRPEKAALQGKRW